MSSFASMKPAPCELVFVLVSSTLLISLWAASDAANRSDNEWAIVGGKKWLWVGVMMSTTISGLAGYVAVGWYVFKIRPTLIALETPQQSPMWYELIEDQGGSKKAACLSPCEQDGGGFR